MKKRIELYYLFIRNLIRVLFFRFKSFLGALNKKFHLYEVKFFFLFLLHRYSPLQFNPRHVGENFKILFRAEPHEWINTTRAGKIAILSKKNRFWFRIKNLLTFGALQSRLEKVIFYSYLTVTLELNNPFDRRVLYQFLEKKMALLERLLKYIKTINGKNWDQTEVQRHIAVFYRNSLLQSRVIKQMEQAVRQEKEPEIVKEAKRGLKKGLQPVLVTKGLSGSYWMRGPDREVLGLFKPFDEEIHAPNNPVGPKYQGTLGLRKTRRGCRAGESAHHEVAAFVVDSFFGFGIVPRTYYAEFEHTLFFLPREDPFTSRRVLKKKWGSFQEYVSGFVSINKLSEKEIQAIPLDEFQLLALLDVIVGNTDRNMGNILFGDEKIAAIDHGLCFPDRIDEFSFWYWSFFKQGEEPFLQSIVDLLHHFPFEKLAYRLEKKCFISPDSLNRMRERVVLFAEAIDAGLVPKQMEKLLFPEFLYPLKDRKETLKERAKEQVQLFIKTLPQST